MRNQNRIQALYDKIDNDHAMSGGQAYGWEGCGVTGTDICEICGLRHHWGRNGQNSGSFDTYETSTGEKLTLAQAARYLCD